MPPFLTRASNAQGPVTNTPVPLPRITAMPPTTTTATATPDAATNKNKVETLFGPPVGVGGNPAPEWTNSWAAEFAAAEKEDELTPEIVKEWIRRSKEEAGDVVPTTTLQALVNLKRPTIKLTPLLSTDDSPSGHTHGIEFEYDCDAARCIISVHALVPSGASDSQLARTVLYSHTFDGGFGKHLTLEDGAILELGKLDTSPSAQKPASDSKEADGTTRPDTAGTAATTLVSSPASTGNRPLTGASSNTATTTANPNARKRFSAFHFRRRTMPPNAVTGPALQVVDTDAAAAAPAAEEDGAAAEGGAATATADGVKTTDEGGVKVMIRLEALDEDDKPLQSRNAQMTYLHIVQLGGTAATSSGSPPTATTSAPLDEEAAIGSSTQSQTHWVVKVVKREALLGPHTFRLQEIYGLASSSSQATVEPAPVTYPPTAPLAAEGMGAATECVLCLSSPREVVLLPCRHLVACRECAVNMVEFGAGGQLTHEQEAAPAAEGGEAGAAAAPAAEGADATATVTANPTAAPTPAATERRRKRKAKGWFCPVCRQPYTALLRITTTPPGKRLSEDSFSHPPIVPPPTSGDPLQATQSEVPVVVPTTTTPAVAIPAPAHVHESGGTGGTIPSGLRSGRNSGERPAADTATATAT